MFFLQTEYHLNGFVHWMERNKYRFLPSLLGKGALFKKSGKIFHLYIRKFGREKVITYMRKGFLIYEELREYLGIYEEAFSQL